MLPSLFIPNYLKREQLAKRIQRKVKIRNTSSMSAEFLLTVQTTCDLIKSDHSSDACSYFISCNKNTIKNRMSTNLNVKCEYLLTKISHSNLEKKKLSGKKLLKYSRFMPFAITNATFFLENCVVHYTYRKKS